MIDAWRERYEEMLGGPIQGMVDLLAEMRSRGVPLFALSNWSAETFPAAQKRFGFLGWFHGTVLSGEVRLLKPDPRIYHLLFETHGVTRQMRCISMTCKETWTLLTPWGCTVFASPMRSLCGRNLRRSG